jgi:predicted anti-sigma-YlaC factor YlaD
MNCIKNKEMIQLYADGELEKNKESYIFDHLANCEECRLFFRALNAVSSSLVKEEFPPVLEKQIFSSLIEKERKNENNFFKKIFVPVFSYSAILLFLIAGVFFYIKMNEYKSEMASVNQQIKYQSETIELLYNSLSPTIVHASYDHEIIIKAKM